MSFSSEIEQATCAAFTAVLQAQQMQDDALLQSALSSQSRMSYFSSGCGDDEEQPSSSGWLSSFGQSHSMMWASMLMSAAMSQLTGLIGLIGRLTRASSSTSLEPAAASIQGGRSQGGRSWPSSAGPGWSGFHSPLENHFIITSAFGPRIDPIGHRKTGFHHGVDIGAPSGTPIRAASAGRVVAAGWAAGYGNYIRIDHGNGRETAYGHLSAIGVLLGKQVKPGQFIGRVGNTGSRSTGPHLHFEVICNGKKENPCDHVHL